MPALLLFLLCMLFPFQSISAEEAVQTDWSGGPGATVEVSAFGDQFHEANDISWSAVPGQIALASIPLESPVKHVVAENRDGAYGLYATDFDRDGDVDIIGTTDRSRQVIIWFNSGSSPPTWTEHIVDNNYRGGTSVHPVDLDGDGDLDLVGAAQTPGNNLKWWRNEGGEPITWTRFTIEDRLPVACNLFVADIDGDGDPDVASTSWSGAYIAWWRNDGRPEDWTRTFISDQFPAAHSAFAFDADEDGDNDVVGTSADTGEVVLFLNDGGDGTSWLPQVIGTGMAGVRYATATDIDGDGRMDLAAAAFNGHLRWWRNDGGTPLVWTEHLVDPLCFGGHYLIGTDLSGDGATDLLVAPWSLDSLIWYRQDPTDPSNWDRFMVDETFTSPLTAFPGDIDGDGALDIVGTSPGLGEIAWWKISAFQASGTLESSVIDLGNDHGLNGWRWESTVPEGTRLTLSVRTGDSPDDLGPWGSEMVNPTVMLCPWKRYLQYHVTMESSEGTTSPILNELTTWWNLPAPAVEVINATAPLAD